MQTKKQKRFVYKGLGFPVLLLNVEMGKVRGVWTPLVNYNKLQRDVAKALASKPARLTGSEIHFIRSYFNMTLAEFGARFSVSHPAVKKWEQSAGQATAMKWSVEKDIRLFILDRLAVNATAIGKLYRELGNEAKGPSKPIKLDLAA
jgi:hypothetical protein